MSGISPASALATPISLSRPDDDHAGSMACLGSPSPSCADVSPQLPVSRLFQTTPEITAQSTPMQRKAILEQEHTLPSLHWSPTVGMGSSSEHQLSAASDANTDAGGEPSQPRSGEAMPPSSSNANISKSRACIMQSPSSCATPSSLAMSLPLAKIAADMQAVSLSRDTTQAASAASWQDMNVEGVGEVTPAAVPHLLLKWGSALIWVNGTR